MLNHHHIKLSAGLLREIIIMISVCFHKNYFLISLFLPSLSSGRRRKGSRLCERIKWVLKQLLKNVESKFLLQNRMFQLIMQLFNAKNLIRPQELQVLKWHTRISFFLFAIMLDCYNLKYAYTSAFSRVCALNPFSLANSQKIWVIPSLTANCGNCC